ncbi:MAG: zinc ABC transporter substrate-binding protein [Candidatus Eisenbacteria sp.]|nr:zinc ABC transporter substrate-binding protein [Candidatus Eisenbacteria bacterium]
MPRIVNRNRPMQPAHTSGTRSHRITCIRFSALFLAAASLGLMNSPAHAVREIFVSIPPQASIVEAIGGEQVNVQILVRPGQDPHTFSPTPKQVVALGRAEIYFYIGLPFEEVLLSRVSAGHEHLTIVDMGSRIEKRMMATAHHHHAEAASDGPVEEQDHHDHLGAHSAHETNQHPDPHIWLSPPLLETIARNVAEALTASDPAHGDFYQQNLERFVQRVAETHARITRILEPCRGAPLFVFHPAFGYFADTYGLEQIAVETAGKDPSPRKLAAMIRRARQEGVRVIFVQPQFDRKSANAIAESIDGVVVPLNPMARDVLTNLEEIASQVEGALGK